MDPISRRRALQMVGTGTLGLGLLGRPARAAGGAERRFLFIMAQGGWDTTTCFVPAFDLPSFELEEGAAPGFAGGIDFVDHPGRPSVRAFFEDYGDRTALINGLEVPSITHERCLQLVLTGRSDAGADDWPSILASRFGPDLRLPHLVMTGPAFVGELAQQVVRIGANGQLLDLLEGAIFQDVGLAAPTSAATAAVDRLVQQRAQQGRLGAAYADALADLEALEERYGDLALAPLQPDCVRDLGGDIRTALDCFEAGLTRCAIVRHHGWCSQGYDTHQDPSLQGVNHELLFGFLNQAMADLDARPGVFGERLADEVTIVLLSEMGRHPRFNGWGGRDHWTYTSALLIGAGVAGGQVVGAVADTGLGLPIDLSTGAPSQAGTALGPGHLGATLLALGDVDPGGFTQDLPITAVMA